MADVGAKRGRQKAGASVGEANHAQTMVDAGEVGAGRSSIHKQLVQNEIGAWPDHKRDEYEERAAILEFDAKLTRENAEIVAFQMMKKAMRK